MYTQQKKMQRLITKAAAVASSVGDSASESESHSTQSQETVRYVTGPSSLPGRRDKNVIEPRGFSDWKKWELDIKGCLKANNLDAYFRRKVENLTAASELDGNEANNGFIENLLMDTVSPKLAMLARLSEYDRFPEMYAAIRAQIKSRNAVEKTSVEKQWRTLKYTSLEDTIV